MAAGTINTTGQIVLNKDLIIIGPVSTGAPLTTLQNNNLSKWNSETAGALGNRFFVVVNGAHLTLENITLSGGLGVGGNGEVSNSTMGGGGGAGMGGAIYLDDNGGLALKSVWFVNNTARGGLGAAAYPQDQSVGGGGGGFGGDAYTSTGGSGGPLGSRGSGGNGAFGSSSSQDGGFGGGGGGGNPPSGAGWGGGHGGGTGIIPGGTPGMPADYGTIPWGDGSGMGGAIFLAGSAALAMTGVTFQGNSVEATMFTPADGGALYAWYGAVAQYSGPVTYNQNYRNIIGTSGGYTSDYFSIDSGAYQQVSAPATLSLNPQAASASTLDISLDVQDNAGHSLVMIPVTLTVPASYAKFSNGSSQITLYTASNGSATTTLTITKNPANFQLTASSGSLSASLNVVNNSVVGAPPADPRSAVVGFADSSDPNVAFIAGNGHVYEMFYAGGWNYSDLNEITGAPSADATRALAGFYTQFNTTRHVIFVSSGDGHVHELYYQLQAPGWHNNDVTAMTGAPVAASGTRLSGYGTSFNNRQHVNFIGVNNDVYELWFDGSWHFTDLTQTTGAPSATPGSALTGYESPNSQGHVNFLSADNHVRDFWYDTAWHLNDLTQAANAPIAIAGSALAGYGTFFNGQQHVDFLGSDSHVHELWFDGAWHHNDLTQSTGAPLAATARALSGYATPFNSQHHVNFIGANNHVYELWDAQNWNCSDLSAQRAFQRALKQLHKHV